MDDHRLSVLYFGDRSDDIYGEFSALCRHSGEGILTSAFIQQAGAALRKEADGLKLVDRRGVPEFRTAQQLNEKYRAAERRHLGVEGALLCLTQLAHHFSHTESRLQNRASSPKSTLAVGAGYGLFAAIAVSCATSAEALVPLAIRAVVLAFRIGCYLQDVLASYCHDVTDPQVWSALEAGGTEEGAQEALAQFHASHSIPTPNRAYISAVHQNTVQISAPHITLQALKADGVFGHDVKDAPSFGPVYAGHINTDADIGRILQLDVAFASTGPARASILSCSGCQYAQNDFNALVLGAARDLLHSPLRYSRTFSLCTKIASGSKVKSCLLISHSPSQPLSQLTKVLATVACLDVTVETPPSSVPSPSSIGGHGSVGKPKLAIVGMSGRFPDAASHQALWELLCTGLDVHRTVPPDRFNMDTHFDPTGKVRNTTHTPYGCWIKNPGLFDPRFFNMSPREALQTDPMQRLAIVTAYEALEMAGYVPNRTQSTRLDRIGTFYGQTSDDWREINAAQDIDTYFITGGVRAFGPGRINYHFGFSGPSLNIDTACSSSAAAMQVACTSLWASECDTAIVGGLSVLGNPDIFSGLSRGQFLSKNGPCATFDNAADGYCRADGCASVIVKRLDDAIADGDNVLAVVLGTATNHSADAVSITHPHGPTQSVLSRGILDEAGVDPLDVDYVEMHGTGTQAGDGTEMVSVTDVFAPADRRRPSDRPLYLGAIKSNVGHGEAASGVTALVKVLMMLQKSVIPPHVGIKKGSVMNVTFPKDLSDRNVNIAFHQTPLKRYDGRPRRVFINNFSAAGGNTGLLLEDAPERPTPETDPRGTHIVTISAKSKGAMIRNAERLAEWMTANPEASLPDVSYTMTARRIQYYWRMSVTATTLLETTAAIRECLRGSFVPVTSNTLGSTQPHTAFMFTGQGSQHVGMGEALYRHFSVFKSAIDDLDRLAQLHDFPSFMPLVLGNADDIDVKKMSPVITQLGLCCFEMALVRLWASWDVCPDIVVGHSLGEYAALYAAGVLSASDAILLVGKRAQLLVEECTPSTHAMLAVQGSVESVTEALADRGVQVACINGPLETVVSGSSDAIQLESGRLKGLGFKCTLLNVPFAFHSAQVDPILDEFESISKSVTFRSPSIPIISSLLGRLVPKEETLDAVYLRRHAREPVNFLGALASAQHSAAIDDKTLWIEVGPHSVCSNMVKATFGNSTVAVPTVRRGADQWKTLGTSLSILYGAGLNPDWNEYHRDFKNSIQLLDLPTYSFDDKNYWLQYEGDWTLKKGQAVAPAPESAPPKPKLSTISVHAIIKEDIKTDVVVIETETNLSREDTKPIVLGHLCNGAPLCPSTLYADMAMTVANYAYTLLRPESEPVGLNVSDVQVPKTLIFDDKLERHMLHSTTTANLALAYADIVFHTGANGTRTEHAHCRVIYGDIQQWRDEFDKTAYLIQSRISALAIAEKAGTASKVSRGLAYKLFSALVDYDTRYRGMEEVTLDSATCEATSKVSFQTNDADSNFFFNPYWIDSCCHISGFVINGTDAVDSREQVYISHGWGSLRFVENLDRHKTYRSYVRMQPVRGTKMMSGDVYVFDGDRVIGMAGDVKFQAIPRKVLNAVLPPRGAAASATQGVALSQEKKTATPPKAVVQQNAGVKAVAAPPSRVSVVQAVLEILTKEIGCDADELVDNIAFADLGCDSLMALTVAGRMREELEVDIDSHAFLEHSTIGAFKKFLAPYDSTTVASAKEDIRVVVKEEPIFPVDADTSNSSSVSDILVSSGNESDTSLTTPLDESDKGLPANSRPRGALSATQQLVRSTIAQEMGVDVDEILAAPDLTALGMDSLMSLTILGSLRESTGLNISNDLFNHSTSLLSIEKALGISPNVTHPRAQSQVVRKMNKHPSLGRLPLAPTTVINTHPGNTTAGITKPPPPDTILDPFPHRKARSVVLQGNPRTAAHQLFMIPDGSGSATSYTEIGQISPSWVVYGLFSPFLKTPEEFNCGVYGMASKMIDEMLVRQPRGPYSLSGWSAGGVVAFEILNQLVRMGEKVDHLIIIDAPCPIIIEPLPRSLHAWFASIGLLGEGDDEASRRKVPEWLLPHFAAAVTALSNYTAVRIPDDKCPNVTTIWCEDGVCKTPSDPRPEPYPTGHALFLLDNRVDFGPNRWDEYLDINKFQSRHIPGNHFSMMHGSYAKMLGELIKEALLS